MPFGIYKVTGESMLPGLRSGDYVLIRRNPRRVRANDLVVVRHPDLGIIIKRVRQVLANDRIILIGDNPDVSTPSELIGEIAPDRVVGRVFYSIKTPTP